jgi:hypothetical protein
MPVSFEWITFRADDSSILLSFSRFWRNVHFFGVLSAVLKSGHRSVDGLDALRVNF